MDKSTNNLLDKLGTHPGQGNVLEQIEKLIRRQQRRKLYEMLDQIDKNKVGDLVSRLKNASRRSGEKGPRYCASRCQIGKGTTNYSGKPSAIMQFSRFIALRTWNTTSPGLKSKFSISPNWKEMQNLRKG